METPKYFWQGHMSKHEVWGFEYDEDSKILTLYNTNFMTITEISFEHSEVDLSTFTDEEINEYLLDFFEEYTTEE